MKLLSLLVILLVFLVGCTQVPEDVPQAEVVEDDTEEILEEETIEETINADGPTGKVIDPSTSSFEFEGFAPGKSHVGSFDTMEGTFDIEDGKIVGFSGIIQANSVNTGIDKLDKHLQNDDFFDVEVYPEITFATSSLTEDMATGELNFHGVSKELSFPVTVTENGVSADFLLDSTDFKFKYVGIDKDIRITFELRA